jgi:exonuclease V gamma subunit
MRFISCLAIAVLATAAQAAEVYKWTDKDGRVHYGDRPKSQTAQEVELRNTTPVPVNTASGEAAANDPRQAECARLTKLYETYNKATVLRETDNLGRTREYTDAERTTLLSQTQQQMQAACAPAATP